MNDHMNCPLNIENGIASCFGRKYKMIPTRTGVDVPNFSFHASEDGIHPKEHKGDAIVRRHSGNKGKFFISLKDLTLLLDKGEKGIVIVGFDDVAVFVSPGKSGFNADGDMAMFDNFTVISERKGLFE